MLLSFGVTMSQNYFYDKKRIDKMMRWHPQRTAPRHTNEKRKFCIFHFDETIRHQGLFMSKPHYTVLSYLKLFGK